MKCAVGEIVHPRHWCVVTKNGNLPFFIIKMIVGVWVVTVDLVHNALLRFNLECVFFVKDRCEL